MNRTIPIAALLFTVVACSADEPREPSQPAVTVTQSADPLENYPLDTGTSTAALEQVSPLAARIDSRINSLRTETVTMDPEQPGWEPRQVRGWYDEDGLVRLSVTEATDAGSMSGETVYYVENGELRVVSRPNAIFLLRPDGTIERWLDDAGNPVEASRTQMEEQSRQLSAAFKRWTGALKESSAPNN